MRLAIYAYNTGSRSAHNLSEALEIPIIRHTNSKFKGWGNPLWTVINWGATECPDYKNVLNKGRDIKGITNKLAAFRLWNFKDGPRCVPFTTDIEQAKQWIQSQSTVICRTTLTGHSGQGIIVAENVSELVPCSLYTRYIPKDKEYRIHYVKWRTEPIFIQQKVRDPEQEPKTWKIRSHKNGFIFQHMNLKPVPPDVLAQAQKAFQVSGLDFGAVDVIYGAKSQKGYVLELNTAPGLEGTTILMYANAFKDIK